MKYDDLNPTPTGNEIKDTYADINPTPAGLNTSSVGSEPSLGSIGGNPGYNRAANPTIEDIKALNNTVAGQPARNPETAPVTNKAVGVAHDLVDRLAEKAAEAEAKIRGVSHQASDEVRVRAGEMQQQTRALSETVEQYLQEHPVKALGIAFGAGLLLSTMLRRS
ncbi:MAG: hypothetical protein U1F76_16935 [Candidatus Competibacteraceae bacterium]